MENIIFDFTNIKISKLDYSGNDERWILCTTKNKYIISERVAKLIQDLMSSNKREDYFNSLSEEEKALIKKLLNNSEKNKRSKKDGMWFKLTLINENHMKNSKIFSFMFNKKISISILICVISMLLYTIVGTNYSYYISKSIREFQGINYMLSIGIVILGAIFHELGHITASTLYGAIPKSLGIGIYFISPVVYVDVDDSWKLKKSQRTVIDIGGVYFQSVYATLLLIIFMFSKNSVFLITYFLFMTSIIFNLNPFLKYDGYWFFSDLLGIYNLNIKFPIVIKAFLKLIFKKKEDFKRLQKNWENKVLISISVYGIVSMIFYMYFSYQIINCMKVYIINTIYNFNILNMLISAFFMFLGIKSILALIQLLFQIFTVKLKDI